LLLERVGMVVLVLVVLQLEHVVLVKESSFSNVLDDYLALPVDEDVE
jgi:hypothetical protein